MYTYVSHVGIPFFPAPKEPKGIQKGENVGQWTSMAFLPDGVLDMCLVRSYVMYVCQ